MGAETGGWQEAMGSEGGTQYKPKKWALCQKNDQRRTQKARGQSDGQSLECRKGEKTGTHPEGKKSQEFKTNAASLQSRNLHPKSFVVGPSEELHDLSA